MKKILAVVIFAIASVAGCRGQIPPTVHTLTITVTNSPCAPGTPASTCGYVFSEAIISGSTCPATSGTSYSPVNQSTPVGQPLTGNAIFVDNTVAGKTVCAIAQAVSGGAVSQPSTAIGPFAVPANLTAPALSSGAIADVRLPQLQPIPGNTVASNELLMLKAEAR
jgi:hypothetical protein